MEKSRQILSLRSAQLPITPFSLAFDCAHPALRAERAATVAALRSRVLGLISAVLSTQQGVAAALRQPTSTAESAALAAFTGGGDLAADEVAFLGYRFLLAAPFDAAAARRHGFAAAAAVGHFLAAARAREHHTLCDDWVAWSDQRLTTVATAWKAALAGLP